MKWRELPEEDRAIVLRQMRGTVEYMRATRDEEVRVIGTQSYDDILLRNIAAHELAIAALEELARGHGEGLTATPKV